MNLLRRTLLKGASATAAGAIVAGLLRPTRLLAREWNTSAHEARTVADAMKLIGIEGVSESTDIVLNAPDIAENGAVVPVDVVSNIPGTESISIFVDKNPFPLTCSFAFSNGALPEASLRIKLGETSRIRAVAKAGGVFYGATREVKVTVGGC